MAKISFEQEWISLGDAQFSEHLQEVLVTTTAWSF